MVGDSSLTRLGQRKETGRVDDPPAFCLCYSHREMVRRIFWEVAFLVLTVLAVCAFSVTALVLTVSILLRLFPSGMVFD